MEGGNNNFGEKSLNNGINTTKEEILALAKEKGYKENEIGIVKDFLDTEILHRAPETFEIYKNAVSRYKTYEEAFARFTSDLCSQFDNSDKKKKEITILILSEAYLGYSDYQKHVLIFLSKRIADKNIDIDLRKKITYFFVKNGGEYAPFFFPRFFRMVEDEQEDISLRKICLSIIIPHADYMGSSFPGRFSSPRHESPTRKKPYMSNVLEQYYLKLDCNFVHESNGLRRRSLEFHAFENEGLFNKDMLDKDNKISLLLYEIKELLPNLMIKAKSNDKDYDEIFHEHEIKISYIMKDLKESITFYGDNLPNKNRINNILVNIQKGSNDYRDLMCLYHSIGTYLYETNILDAADHKIKNQQKDANEELSGVLGSTNTKIPEINEEIQGQKTAELDLLIENIEWSNKHLDEIKLSYQILKLTKDGAILKEDSSLVYYLSSYSCVTLLKRLIEGGLDFSKNAAKIIELLNDYDRTEMERAPGDRAKVAKLLVDTVNNQGDLDRILLSCSMGGFSEALESAINKGGNLSIKDTWGRNLICIASTELDINFPPKDMTVVNILLKYGANPYEKDNEGKDTFDNLKEFTALIKEQDEDFKKRHGKSSSLYYVKTLLELWNKAEEELYKREHKDEHKDGDNISISTNQEDNNLDIIVKEEDSIEEDIETEEIPTLMLPIDLYQRLIESVKKSTLNIGNTPSPNIPLTIFRFNKDNSLEIGSPDVTALKVINDFGGFCNRYELYVKSPDALEELFQELGEMGYNIWEHEKGDRQRIYGRSTWSAGLPKEPELLPEDGPELRDEKDIGKNPFHKEEIVLFQGKKYNTDFFSSNTPPVPHGFTIYERWHGPDGSTQGRDPISVSRDILGSCGKNNDPGWYSTDGKTAFFPWDIERMTMFVKDCTTYDIQEWNNMIRSADRRGPGMTYAVRNFCQNQKDKAKK